VFKQTLKGQKDHDKLTKAARRVNDALEGQKVAKEIREERVVKTREDELHHAELGLRHAQARYFDAAALEMQARVKFWANTKLTLEGLGAAVLGGALSAPAGGLSAAPVALTTAAPVTPAAGPAVAPPGVVAGVAERGPSMSPLSELAGSSAAPAIMAEDGDEDYEVDGAGDDDDIDA